MFLSSSSAESDTFLTIYLSSFSSLCCTHIRSRVSCFVYYIIYITPSLFSCFVISSYRNNYLFNIVMASQQPRPAWFRFSSLAARATAPPTTTAPTRPPPPPTVQAPPPAIPARPPAPMPALVRPSIPIRPSFPPPPAAAAPPPRPSPATPPAPPKSPIATTPAPAVTPPRSPIAAPPRSPITAPTRSPIAAPTRSPAPPAVGAATRSPIVAPAPQPSPPRSPPKSPIPTPTRSPPRSSPVQRSTVTANSNTPPKTKPLTPPSSSKPTNAAKPIPSSPKEIRTPPPSQSPQIKPLSHPPSPFTLPPAQINTDGGPLIEHKTVLEQHTTVVDKPMKSPRGHNNSAHSSFNGKRESMKSRTSTKKPSESEGLGMRVITLAGENKGAIMELSNHTSQNKKNHFVGNPRTLQNSSRSSSESDEDGSSSNKSKRGMRTPMTAAYLNSNVQGLNNSILYNTNFQHNDPGVHLSLTRNSNGAPLHRHG